jgi:alpha-1,6-mannosyltransferase
LLEAYPQLCERLGVEPALVFASLGPYKEKVLEASQKWIHVQYIGFVNGAEEMARWYASTDMGLALSAWETFGLSILEGMASGQVFVGADRGAAKEHIEASGCGKLVPKDRADLLTDAIVQIAESGKLSDCSLKARAFAEQFTWNACFERQLELYRKVVANFEIKI